MVKGLDRHFKDFKTGDSFDTHQEFVTHLAGQTGRTHTGKVPCQKCGNPVIFVNKVRSLKANGLGHPIDYCKECKARLIAEFQEEEGEQD